MHNNAQAQSDFCGVFFGAETLSFLVFRVVNIPTFVLTVMLDFSVVSLSSSSMIKLILFVAESIIPLSVELSSLSVMATTNSFIFCSRVSASILFDNLGMLKLNVVDAAES